MAASHRSSVGIDSASDHRKNQRARLSTLLNMKRIKLLATTLVVSFALIACSQSSQSNGEKVHELPPVICDGSGCRGVGSNGNQWKSGTITPPKSGQKQQPTSTPNQNPGK